MLGVIFTLWDERRGDWQSSAMDHAQVWYKWKNWWLESERKRRTRGALLGDAAAVLLKAWFSESFLRVPQREVGAALDLRVAFEQQSARPQGRPSWRRVSTHTHTSHCYTDVQPVFMCPPSLRARVGSRLTQKPFHHSCRIVLLSVRVAHDEVANVSQSDSHPLHRAVLELAHWCCEVFTFNCHCASILASAAMTFPSDSGPHRGRWELNLAADSAAHCSLTRARRHGHPFWRPDACISAQTGPQPGSRGRCDGSSSCPSLAPSSSLDDPYDSGGQHGRSGLNPPYGAPSGWLVITPWRLGAVHESHGARAARRNLSPRVYEPPGVGQLPVTHTPRCGDQCGEQRGPDLKHGTTTPTRQHPLASIPSPSASRRRQQHQPTAATDTLVKRLVPKPRSRLVGMCVAAFFCPNTCTTPWPRKFFFRTCSSDVKKMKKRKMEQMNKINDKMEKLKKRKKEKKMKKRKKERTNGKMEKWINDSKMMKNETNEENKTHEKWKMKKEQTRKKRKNMKTWNNDKMKKTEGNPSVSSPKCTVSWQPKFFNGTCLSDVIREKQRKLPNFDGYHFLHDKRTKGTALHDGVGSLMFFFFFKWQQSFKRCQLTIQPAFGYADGVFFFVYSTLLYVRVFFFHFGRVPLSLFVKFVRGLARNGR